MIGRSQSDLCLRALACKLTISPYKLYIIYKYINRYMDIYIIYDKSH